uniref:DUF7576 family protein n=1 Tax=Haloprofundus sp. MHR1 TaxID=2572921 RepID=UPI001F313026|nr:hypothetical protein [Haloprofundus sp. MHR1]
MQRSESADSTRSDSLVREASDAEVAPDANGGRSDDSLRERGVVSHRRKWCEYCGAAIDTSEWYPVVTVGDGNSVLRIYPLCGDDCRELWEEAHHGDSSAL